MVSTFTPNIQLEEPARGDQVGTWDTPVNNNMTEIDLVVGGIATISAAAGSVALSAAQLQSRMITLNSTLIANITLTFKTSFVKDYLVQHAATGSSQFTITLQTTASGGQAICVPPGETTSVYNDGTNFKFLNLDRVGMLRDFIGSSVPAWISACTVPPYVNADGTTISSATYPQYFNLYGGTLPDSRGRVRAALNQGTARMASGSGGVDGNTNLAGGGGDAQTLTVAQIPGGLVGNNSNSLTLTQNAGRVVLFANTATISDAANGVNVDGSPAGACIAQGISLTIGSGALSMQITNAGGGSHPNMQPTLVAGLTLVRVA